MKVDTPAETFETACRTGCTKIALTKTNLPKLAVLSAAAGAYISLGALLSLIVGQGFPEASAMNPSLAKLLSGLVFPIGLLLIVVLGGELFTGNNATLIPALTRRNYTALDVFYNWMLVWIGNFIGALLFVALFVCATGTLDTAPWRDAAAGLATTKVNLGFTTTLFRGIGANWCVCLAVWLAMSGKTLMDKFIGCWIPVAAFVILGWEHCVANMFFIPVGMICGADISIGQFLIDNLLPATLGNIAGGALMVGTLHAYVHKKTGA